jgi:hypothetical protein
LDESCAGQRPHLLPQLAWRSRVCGCEELNPEECERSTFNAELQTSNWDLRAAKFNVER